MSSIFISYRRRGVPIHARALFERLSREFGRDEVFIDLEGIDFGLDFVDVLNSKLQGCQVMLALIDPQWAIATDERGETNPSIDYVRTEIETALARGIRTIPVLLDGAKMPGTNALPVSLHPLSRLNALDLDFTHFEAEITRLIGVVRKDLGVPAGSLARRGPTTANMRQRSAAEYLQSQQPQALHSSSNSRSTERAGHVIGVRLRKAYRSLTSSRLPLVIVVCIASAAVVLWHLRTPSSLSTSVAPQEDAFAGVARASLAMGSPPPTHAGLDQVTQSRIEYLANDDTPRTAWLQNADVRQVTSTSLKGMQTVDAQWVVHNRDGTEPVVQWIYIRATDRSTRKVRTACEYHSASEQRSGGETPAADINTNKITCDFIYAYADGSDEHREDHIWFLAPDDKPYLVKIAPASGPFPTPAGQPMFVVFR
jgi:hypothetical protein